MNYKKLIRDGMVAVLYSPGYGAGWYTWNTDHIGLLFDPKIVLAVEDGDKTLAIEIANRKYPGVFTGGGGELEIDWIDEGSQFKVEEYDGFESIVKVENLGILTA